MMMHAYNLIITIVCFLHHVLNMGNSVENNRALVSSVTKSTHVAPLQETKTDYIDAFPRGTVPLFRLKSYFYKKSVCENL